MVVQQMSPVGTKVRQIAGHESTRGTHSDELEHLIDEDDRYAEVQYGLPLSPVERRNRKQSLQNDKSVSDVQDTL